MLKFFQPKVVCVRCREKESAAWYAENKKRSRKALKRAKKVDSSNTFVKSCDKFFFEKGYLTDKQIEALENVERRVYDDPWEHW